MRIKFKIVPLIATFLLLCASTAPAQSQLSLGTQSENFGSDAQARAILKLIESDPDQRSYQISYTTSIDVVVFGVDLNKDSIARIHQRPDGHGTGERWQGSALYRIKKAADGGSLNDTPSGKSPGTMQSF